MQFSFSVIAIKQVTIAIILVDSDQTYPAVGTQLIASVQRYFPTLPIALLAPRIGGFSRSFAHFDLTNLIAHISADEIHWDIAELPEREVALPF